MSSRREIMPTLPIVFGLAEPEAAAAIGVGVTKFRAMVEDRRMPRPRRIDGRLVYDVDELRQAFKALPHDGAGRPSPDLTEEDDPWNTVAV